MWSLGQFYMKGRRINKISFVLLGGPAVLVLDYGYQRLLYV